MMDQETKQILAQAASKVRELRRQNEVLSAKVSTMELLAGFLYAQPREPSVGMEEDIAWKIEQHLRTAEKTI